MNRKINFAVIGTGRIGSMHVANIVNQVPEANLVAICDIRLDVAQAVADKWGITRVVRDYHELLADESIEAVLIATTTSTHAEIIKDCANAGKHIFCEKPIALDLAKIDEALEAVDLAGVKLQVGFNRRFDKSFQKVREIVKSGELGRPCMLKITNRDPELPSKEFLRVSGGIFLDMTIHDFDMARFLIDEDVEEVYAAGAVRVDPAIGDAGDLDTALVTLRFKNGVLGVIDNSRKAVYGYDQRVEVLGSAGGAMVANNYPNTAVISDAASVRRDLPLNFFMDRYLDSFLVEVTAFADAVLDDNPTPVDGVDGRAAVALGIAARRSHEENRPVRLEEIEG